MAFWIADQGGGEMAPYRLAAFRHVTLLQSEARYFSSNQTFCEQDIVVEVFRMRDFHERMANHFLLGIAEHSGKSVIHFRDAQIHASQDHGDRTFFKNLAES